MRHGRQGCWLVIALMTVCLPRHGAAQAVGNPDGGRSLATAWCTDCHQIDGAARPSASDAVPSFPAIAAMPSTTALSIRAFLSTPHGAMPDFKLTNAQMDDIGAFILSQRARQQ